MLEQENDTDDGGRGRQYQEAAWAPAILIDGIKVQHFLKRNENKGPESIIQEIAANSPQQDNKRERGIPSFQQIPGEHPVNKWIAVQHAHRYPKRTLENIPFYAAS